VNFSYKTYRLAIIHPLRTTDKQTDDDDGQSSLHVVP